VLQVCSFPVGGGLLALCLPRLKGALFSFLQGKRDEQENHVDLMKGKIDSDTGREMITRDLQQWNRCLAICVVTSVCTALRYAEKPRWMVSGSCTA